VEGEFRKKLDKFKESLENNIDSFTRAFPDFNDDFDIYIIYSLGEMDGGSRTINGNQYFIFGIDGMTSYHQGIDDTSFFYHELFHMYHIQHFEPKGIMLHPLWMEGLATYVSHWLNPVADYKDLLLNLPEGLVSSCEEDLKFLALDLDSKLKSRNEDFYVDYFMLYSQHNRIPKRAGYYIGYLVAKELHMLHSMEALVKLSGEKLNNLVSSALQKLVGE
jgi:hypothetical protein